MVMRMVTMKGLMGRGVEKKKRKKKAKRNEL